MKQYRKIYVCSPLSASTEEGIRQNMLTARRYMERISALFCCRAVAPHAFLPAFLDDHTPEERELALHFGLKFLEGCDALVICGNRISRGMEGEIIHAINCGIDILHYTESHIDRYDFSFFAADRIRRE